MARPEEKTEEQLAKEEATKRQATKDQKKAKADKKIAYTGEGSVGGHYYLKKGDAIPEFMKKNDKYKIAVELWFE